MKILNGIKKLVKKGVATVKHCFSAIKSGVRSCVSAICGALTRVKVAVCPAAGEGYVDTGVKIIISVVIGGHQDFRDVLVYGGLRWDGSKFGSVRSGIREGKAPSVQA